MPSFVEENRREENKKEGVSLSDLGDRIRFNENDPNDIFDLVELLGEGSYGAVYKGFYKENVDNLPPVAIKIIPAEEDLTTLEKEISILKKCTSPYIVKFFDCFLYDGELWIIMEFCMGGSVSDMIDVSGKCLDESEIRSVCACIVLGLCYLHSSHNIHRDLKAGNILISREGLAKLADFGVSAQLNNTISKRRTVIGTPFWMAPEVIQETSYDGKADLWSLGITCIEMAEGKPPHFNVHPMRAIFLIPSKPAPRLSNESQWSADFVDFVATCLQKDPQVRKNSAELLKHPFIINEVNQLLKKAENSGSSQDFPGMEPLADLVERNLENLALYRENDNPEIAEDVHVDNNQLPAIQGQQHHPSTSLVSSRDSDISSIINNGTLRPYLDDDSLVDEVRSSSQAPLNPNVSNMGHTSTLITNHGIHSKKNSFTKVNASTLRRQDATLIRSNKATPNSQTYGNGTLQHRRNQSSNTGLGSGTIIRHVQNISAHKRQPTNSQKNEESGNINPRASQSTNDVRHSSETINFQGTSNQIEALKYFQNNDQTVSESEEKNTFNLPPPPPQTFHIVENDNTQELVEDEGAKIEITTTLFENKDYEVYKNVEKQLLPSLTHYQRKKLRDLQSSTAQDIQEELKYLEEQFREDIIALQISYQNRRKKLENALQYC